MLSVDILDVIGRLLIAALFLVSAIAHMADWPAATARCRNGNVPVPAFALSLWTVTEIVGGAMVLLGFHASLAALPLAAGTLYAIVVFHPFWSGPIERRPEEAQFFFSNIAVIGGLLFLCAHGTGAISVDRYF